MQGTSKLRSAASLLIRKHRWLPPILTVVCASAFAMLAIKSAPLLWLLGSEAALVFVSFIWGYAERAFRVINYPSLLNLPRRKYGEVWDALAATSELAKAAACGHEGEGAVRRSAHTPVKNLIELAGVGPDDDILEFGCGVARVGLELALAVVPGLGQICRQTCWPQLRNDCAA